MSSARQLAPAIIGDKIHKTFHRDKGEDTARSITYPSKSDAAHLPHWSDRMERERPRSCVWPPD